MGDIVRNAGIIYSIAVLCICIVRRFDAKKKAWSYGERELVVLFGYCGINGYVISRIAGECGMDEGCSAVMCVMAGCLLFACMTDVQSCEVYEFTWWIGDIAGLVLLCGQMSADVGEGALQEDSLWRQAVQLLCYILLQELVFGRAYGRADCHAFVLCAMAGSALGLSMTDYLLHMLLAFGGLAVVQAFRGNIARDGNLRQPVAFLPYITFSFWVLLFLEKSVILKRISEINL